MPRAVDETCAARRPTLIRLELSQMNITKVKVMECGFGVLITFAEILKQRVYVDELR